MSTLEVRRFHGRHVRFRTALDGKSVDVAIYQRIEGKRPRLLVQARLGPDIPREIVVAIRRWLFEQRRKADVAQAKT